MDDLTYWQDLLAGRLGVVSDTPHSGYYRRRPYRGAPWQPVAIYVHEGELIAVAGDRQVPVHTVWSVFLEAITEQQYRRAREVGHFEDEYEVHRHSQSNTPMTTELRDAKAIMPIIRGTTRGTCDTDQ